MNVLIWRFFKEILFWWKLTFLSSGIFVGFFNFNFWMLRIWRYFGNFYFDGNWQFLTNIRQIIMNDFMNFDFSENWNFFGLKLSSNQSGFVLFWQ